MSGHRSFHLGLSLLVAVMVSLSWLLVFPGVGHALQQGKVVFTSNAAGEYDIYAMTVDDAGNTGTPVNLTADVSGNLEFPSWSPDGSQIVYGASGAGEVQVWKMSADGSGKTQLTSTAGYHSRKPRYSPDASRIVFYRHYGTGSCAAYSTAELCTMNPDGSSVSCYGNTSGHGEYFPVWSPDGGKILYSRDEGTCSNPYDLYKMNADGTGKTLFYPSGGNDGDYQFAIDWSDTGKILFEHRDMSPSVITRVFWVNEDGTGATELTHPGATENYASTFAFSGTKIIYHPYNAGFLGLWMSNLDGTDRVQLSDLAGISGRQADFVETTNLVEKIVFISNRSGTDDVWLMNPDGSDPVQLTNDAANDYAPVLSPDGQYVVWYSNLNGRYAIWRMNVDGTNRVRLTDPETGVYYADSSPAVSPDGSEIAFARQTVLAQGSSAPVELFVMDINGGNVRQLTTGATSTNNYMEPSWSPDGSKILYVRRSAMDLYYMNAADGSGVTLIPETTNRYVYPRNGGAWASQGAYPILTNGRNANDDIYTTDISGSVWNLVLDLPSPAISPSWSPDGQRITFNSENAEPGNADVYVVDADGQNLTRITTSAGADFGPSWGYVKVQSAIIDSDADGMPDSWETQYFGDLTHDGTADTDSDGLTDLQEYQNNTNPNLSDTDRDGLSDGFEVNTNGSDPTMADGLVVYLPFDGDANDASANGNNGTTYGGLAYATGLSNGQSASFDGINDYIEVPETTNLDGFNEMTVSVWVKPGETWNTETTRRDILYKGTPGGATSYGVNYADRSGTNEFRGLQSIISGGHPIADVIQLISPFEADQWFHLMLVHEASGTTRMLVNGEAVGTIVADTLTGTIEDITDLLTIGRRPDNQYYFKGQLDELRIYSRALSSIEAEEIFNEGGNDLVFSEDFNDNDIGDWTAGTIYQIPAVPQSSPIVSDGRYINTNGTTYGGHHRLLPAVIDSIQFTIEADFKWDGNNGTQAVGLYVNDQTYGTDTGANGYTLFFNAQEQTLAGTPRIRVTKSNNGAYQYVATADLASADTNWHNVRATRMADGSWRLFLDHIELTLTENVQDTEFTSFSHISTFIDKSQSYPASYKGIDNIKIYRSLVGPTNKAPNTPANPDPANAFSGAVLSPTLSWSGGDPDAGDTVTYDVYFGTDSGQLSVVSSQPQTTYAPPALAYNTVYYWKIVARDGKGGIAEGPVWSFTTVNYPVAVLSNLPPNTTNQTTTGISVGGDDVVSYSYRLDGGAWSNEIDAANAINETGLSDGSHTLNIIAKSSADVWQPEANATTFSWTVDTTPPVVSGFSASDQTSGSAILSNDRTIAVSATADGAAVRWLITESATVPTPAQMNTGSATAMGTYTIVSAGDGVKTLYLWTMDAAGNIGAATQATITLDTTTEVTISGGSQCTSGTSLSLSGIREDGATVTVESVSSAVIGTVQYPTGTTWQVAVSGLPLGSTEITAIATDAAGNWKSDSVTVRQSTPATAVINTGTGSLLADGTSTLLLNVSVEDSGHNPVCDGETFSVLTTLGSITPSEYTTSGGQFSCQLKASTALGKASVSVKDGETTLGSAEVVMASGAISKLVFTKSDGTALPEPMTINPGILSPFIQVQVQDDYGHAVNVTSTAMILLNSTVDNEMTFTPVGGSATQGETAINIPAGSSSNLFKYQTTHSGEITITAAEFPNTLGWTDAAMAVLVGSTGPVAGLSGAPSGIVSTTSATVTVGGDGITAYKYKLDGGSWSAAEIPVATPVQLSGLSNGSHTLYVIGKNAAGTWQAEASATSATWTVDTTCVAQLTGAPNGTVSTRDASITVSGADVVSYRYSIDGGAWSTEIDTTVAISLTGLADGSHTLYVTGKNSGGVWQGQASATTATWTIDTSGPAAPIGVVTATNGSGKVIVRWLNDSSSNIVGYNVYRSDTQNGTFVLINSFIVNELEVYLTKIYQRYSDSGLINGVTYWYKVTAVSGTGIESGFSSSVSGVPVALVGGDFAIEPQIKSQVVNTGESISYQIYIRSEDGFNQPVTLTATCPELPSGVSMSFGANIVLPPGTATLTVGVPFAIDSGEFAIKISGNGGNRSHEEYITLKIVNMNDNDTLITADANSDDVLLGQKIEIAGQLLPQLAAGITVDIQIKKPGEAIWTTYTEQIDQYGRYRFAYWPDTLGTFAYRARWKGTTYLPECASPEGAFRVGKGKSTIRISTPTEIIIPGTTVTIEVDVDPDLIGVPILIEVLKPGETVPSEDPIQRFTGEAGKRQMLYTLDQSLPGVWKFKASWPGTEEYLGAVSIPLVLYPGVEVGEALIVAGGGMDTDNTLWPTTEYLANRFYKLLKSRRFTDPQIHYISDYSYDYDLNGDGKADIIVDDHEPSPDDVRQYLESLYPENLPPKVNANKPLIIYLVDHGAIGAFQINKGVFLQATDLDGWLDSLQENTGAKVVVIAEACHSGTFIDMLKPTEGQNRILISSSNIEKSIYSQQGMQSFSQFFIENLGQGNSLSGGFNKAVSRMQSNTLFASYQTPRLVETNSGVDAGNFYVGGDFVFGDILPEIKSVTPNQVISAGILEFFAEVVDLEGLDSVWVSVMPPGYKVPESTDPNFTPVVELPKVVLTDSDGDDVYTGQYEFAYNGTYVLTFFVRDQGDNVASQEVQITVENGVDPTPGIKGDVNGDEVIDLADAILALKVAGGFDTKNLNVNLGADVDEDGKIGLQEVLFVLQSLAGLRD